MNDDENLKLLLRHTGWSKGDCKMFMELITRYLDSCGYFMQDCDIPFLNTLPGLKLEPYASKGIAKWVLDFALQFNMECGNEYSVRKIND